MLDDGLYHILYQLEFKYLHTICHCRQSTALIDVL